MEENKLINTTIPICGCGSHGYSYCYRLWEHAHRQGSQCTRLCHGTQRHSSPELLVTWKEGTEPGDDRETLLAESDLSLALLQELLPNIQSVLPPENAFKYLCAFRFLENDGSYSRDNHMYRKPEVLKLSLQPNYSILSVESGGVSFLCLQV